MASFSSLTRIFAKKLTPILTRQSNCSAVAVRTMATGYWNRDWMPGKFPKTQEEREAAAKKYGLRVEDYEPYPDDGEGYGDYPKLPLKSWDGRDPYEDWDVPTLRRNFNEPLGQIVQGEEVNLPDGEQAISNQLGVKKPGVNKPEGKTTKGRKSHNSAVDDMHVDADAVIGSRWSPDVEPLMPYWKMVLIFVVFYGSVIGFLLYTKDYRLINPIMPKQYPYKGKEHYTFELVD